MTGKNKSDETVGKKQHLKLSPKKLDLKKMKEDVKLMGMVVAETEAVQAELRQRVERSLLNGEDPGIPGQQLRQVNIMSERLDATVDKFILGQLDALDKADRDKGI